MRRTADSSLDSHGAYDKSRGPGRAILAFYQFVSVVVPLCFPLSTTIESPGPDRMAGTEIHM